MTVSTTYRADARTAVDGFLTAFQAANPTLLFSTYRARPGSLHPPCAFVGDFREPSIGLDMSIVTRQPQIEVWLVQGEYDNAETMDRQDILVDAFISYLANNPHVGSGVLISLGTDDREVTLTGPGGSTATYLATVVTLGLDIQEGGL